MKYICLLALLLIPSSVLAEEDLQLWETTKVSYDVNEVLELRVENESKYSLFDNGFYYTHADFGGTLAPQGGQFKYLGHQGGVKFGAYFRQILELKDEWIFEGRPYVDVTSHYKFLNLVKYSQRFRVELRLINTQALYRLRTRGLLELGVGEMVARAGVQLFHNLLLYHLGFDTEMLPECLRTGTWFISDELDSPDQAGGDSSDQPSGESSESGATSE